MYFNKNLSSIYKFQMDIDVKLLKCVDLLTEYHKLIDTCMVHFITDDLFKLIPQGRVSLFFPI